MKRIHPFLAVALVALAVVLVTLAMAASAEGQGRTPPSEWASIPVVNGHPIFDGSPECSPRTDHGYVPTVQRANAIRYFTRRVLELDLDTKALTTPLSYETWRELIKLDLGQKFFDRPVIGDYTCPAGWNGGPDYPYPCRLCAAGVGYLVPYISTSEPERVEALIAHETTNARLGLLQRSDLFDGPYVSSVVRRVGEWMGGFQTSGQVLPPLAVQDAADMGLPYVDENSDLVSRQSKPAQGEDVPDVVREQFGARDALAPCVPAGTDGVADVVDVADDLKVSDAIVRGVEVDVVDLFSGDHSADERLRNHAVDNMRRPDLLAVEADGCVDVAHAVGIGYQTKHTSTMRLQDAVIENDNAVLGAHPSEIRCGVSPLRTDDWAPFLSGEFFWGKVLVSHREPPAWVPVVRSGWEGATSRRAASIVPNPTNTRNEYCRVEQWLGGWKQE